MPPEKETVRVINCVGYCNLPLFVSADNSSKADSMSRIRIETVFIANPADHVQALSSPNGPIASVTPFTNALVAHANGADIKIIAGSGANGLALIGNESFRGPESLAGGKIGTVPGDTLEQLAYAYVEAHNEIKDKVEFKYFTDPIALIQALKTGEVAAITHVEPFASNLVKNDKMKLIARGEEVWGQTHPDCVLVCTQSAIRTRRADLVELIRMFLIAEKQINDDMPGAVAKVAEPIYKMKPDELLLAVKSQFPKIDIRDSEAFMINRAVTLRNLGYVKNGNATANIFDFSLLEEAIKMRKDDAK